MGACEDQLALVEATASDGVRLLANLDPLNAGQNRDLLVPDPAMRRRIWTVLGGPGTVLVAGEVGGLWRPTKKGKKLLITVDPLAELPPSARDELAVEATRVAPFRGAEIAELRISAL